MESNLADWGFDIFVVAGQSNAEGCGRGHKELKFKPHEPIYHLNKFGKVVLAKEIYHRVYGKAVSFYHYFGDLYNDEFRPHRKVLMLNCAVGGTGFADKKWGINDVLFERMITRINSFKADKKNCFKGVLWHQGEQDVEAKYDTELYRQALSSLIELTRMAIGEDVPFISGNMSVPWRSERPYSADIADCTRELMAEIKNADYVETEGIDCNVNDEVHFSRKGQKELAKRYFEAYKKLTCKE